MAGAKRVPARNRNGAAYIDLPIRRMKPAYQNLMVCSLALGDPSAAAKQFEECRRRLREGVRRRAIR